MMWPVGEDPRWRAVGAACGLVGPAAFVAGWAAVGATTAGYSPARQPISDLARIGAPHRLAMTAALVVYGLCLLCAAPVLGRALGRSLLAAAVALLGVSALGVAAFPLTPAAHSTGDAAHAAFAVTGYLAAAATPLVGAVALRARGERLGAAVSLLAALVAAAALVLALSLTDPGLAQRVGLGVTDLWLMVTAAAVAVGSAGPAPRTALG